MIILPLTHMWGRVTRSVQGEEVTAMKKNLLNEIGSTFQVRVVPKAAMNKITVEQNPDNTKSIRVYVTAAPQDNKANKEVLKLLSKELGISKSALTIVKGLKSKNKIIRIDSI